MRLILNQVPVAKMRPRFKRLGSKVITFDAQKEQSRTARCLLIQEMAQISHLRLLESSLSVQMTFHTPIPNSWSQKRRKSVLGKPDARRPDCDNYIKFYLDIMNNLIYRDDNQVTELWCEKKYSDRPRVEIFIIEKKEGNMVNEHVITVKENLTLEDLNYMSRKANRLGVSHREIVRVYMEEDDEGKHYYFEVEAMKHGIRNKA